MSRFFEELAWAETPMGILSLRRKLEPTKQIDVYEVKLGDEFLMSSLFTDSEVALARLGLAAVEGQDLDVVVGGLGLGYTARTVLEDDRVGALLVIDALADVIDWHERELLPDASVLTADPRCRLVHGDFFAMAAGEDGFDPEQPGRVFDAVLVDIDHTPRHTLDGTQRSFYTADGLRVLCRHLRPGGVFGLWSDDPPDDAFVEVAAQVFDTVDSRVVTFPSFHTGGESSCSVYVATTSG